MRRGIEGVNEDRKGDSSAASTLQSTGTGFLQTQAKRNFAAHTRQLIASVASGVTDEAELTNLLASRSLAWRVAFAELQNVPAADDGTP